MVTEKQYREMGIQVNIKHSCQSKATNTKMKVNDTATSPIKKITMSVQTSPPKWKRILDFSSEENSSLQDMTDDDYDDDDNFYNDEENTSWSETYLNSPTKPKYQKKNCRT